MPIRRSHARGCRGAAARSSGCSPLSTEMNGKARVSTPAPQSAVMKTSCRETLTFCSRYIIIIIIIIIMK
ncbi:hypothetical protein CgunFtcFv8_009939 [Champsocephalus gunnari]|uniref:Uncharacterized protein n=1 Tax=Champsocephalus gunnari TaxID=52237 RepID=A0AAN8C3E4_CHAGU|nr:hypothetical protein CgunFtcFv8_009939 [Champsocephalus gunnari]